MTLGPVIYPTNAALTHCTRCHVHVKTFVVANNIARINMNNI